MFLIDRSCNQDLHPTAIKSSLSGDQKYITGLTCFCGPEFGSDENKLLWLVVKQGETELKEIKKSVSEN